MFSRAGAVHSPHILMLSGIGPSEHLSAHNIPTLVDLTAVGANLVDHPIVDFIFKDKMGVSLSFLKPANVLDRLKSMRALIQYSIFKRGPLCNNVCTPSSFNVEGKQRLIHAVSRWAKRLRLSGLMTGRSFRRMTSKKSWKIAPLARIAPTWSYSALLWDTGTMVRLCSMCGHMHSMCTC